MYIYLPETKGRPLEDMSQYFAEITGDRSIIEAEENLYRSDDPSLVSTPVPVMDTRPKQPQKNPVQEKPPPGELLYYNMIVSSLFFLYCIVSYFCATYLLLSIDRGCTCSWNYGLRGDMFFVLYLN